MQPDAIALCALGTVTAALGVAIWFNSRQWVSRDCVFNQSGDVVGWLPAPDPRFVDPPLGTRKRPHE